MTPTQSRRRFLQTTTALTALAYTGHLQAEEKPGQAGIATTPDHIRQQIDGFGFSEAFGMAQAIQNLPEKERNDLLNLMFSSNGGMGYSILRNIIGEGPKDAKPGQNTSIEPSPNEYNWDGDKDQIWLMNEAKKRGCTRFLSTVWSPPPWMKTNNDKWSGELKADKYQAFADYLATYVLEYKKRFDLDIYAISPTNEPSFIPTEHYASINWSSGQLKKFLKENLIPTFAARQVPAEIVIAEQNSWKDEYINDILSDSTCNKAVHIVAAHAYADTKSPFMPIELRTGQFQTAMAQGKRIWETEVSAGDTQILNMNDGVYWARVVHTHMIEDNVSGWLYWWGAAGTRQRSSLVAIDSAAGKYQLTKRFFTIAHFARFIRPGYHRVDANPSPAKNVFFSAYLAPDSKRLVCVAINDDATDHPLEIQPGAFPATACIAVRTSNTETHTKLPPITKTDGKWIVPTTSLSVTTFIFT